MNRQLLLNAARSLGLTLAFLPALHGETPSLDQLLSVRSAARPKVSPDGRFVCWEVGETDWKENAYVTHLWLADTQKAMVTQALSAHQPGQVSLRGEVWRARPAPDEPGTLETGAEVMVEGIEGVTLTVRRIQ